jgi:tRNA1(Val) A37 N6-methylase TrmN6
MPQGEDLVDPVAETRDTFLGGRIAIVQPKDGYRAGLDAVLLAAALSVDASHQARIADLGAGVGTVGLCIAARLAAVEVVLIEREPILAAFAVRNIAANGFDARASVIVADLAGPAAVLDNSGAGADTFDHVVANPPYQTEGEGRPPQDALKAASHMMAAGGIERWVRTAVRLARPRGTVTMIHRADALAELLAAFDTRLGALTIRPIHPRDGWPANRVIVSGSKGSRAPAQILPGLMVHGASGHVFTPQMQQILKVGAAIDEAPQA